MRTFQGAKRPPSPPSPALRPNQIPPPRSEHLRNLYARQRQATPPGTVDPFDAPVPNETYADEDVPQTAEGQEGGQGVTGGTDMMGGPQSRLATAQNQEGGDEDAAMSEEDDDEVD